MVFPEYRKAWNEFFRTAIDELGWKQDPILSRIHKSTTEYAGKVQHVDTGAETAIHPPMMIEGKMLIAIQDIETTNIAAIVQAIREAARSWSNSIKNQFFPRLNSILDESGRTIDAREKPLTPDLYLDALETMDIDFDESGIPKLPCIYAHPNVVDAFLKCPFTKEHEQRCSEIIKKKWEEYNARKHSRRLS